MKNTVWIFLLLISLTACKNDKTSTSEKSTETTHEYVESEEDLELNDGQKWFVNEEMKPFVKAGEERVEKYIKEKKGDYKSLAAQLTEHNNQLIKSCTMTGKSHDELHKWLHPHLELVAELGKAEKPGDADQIIEKIDKSYATYHQFFQ